MEKIRISAVSYLNTAPFIYGLEHSMAWEYFDLTKDSPVECAEKLMRGEADIGLVPVVALMDQSQWRPMTEWGIAGDGPVQSVLLVGEVPIDQMESIYLDYQSKTSNRLLQILCDEYFKCNVSLQNSQPGYEDEINGVTGGLLIGDRALSLKGKFSHQYDLSSCWKSLTGLPFVFARWASTRELPEEIVKVLDSAFQFGTDHIELVIRAQEANYPDLDLRDYLGRHIRYKLEDIYLKGLATFIDKLSLVEQNW